MAVSSTPEQTRREVHVTARCLQRLALSNVGPNARATVSQSTANASSLLLCSASALALPELSVAHPAARLLVQAALAHRRNAAAGADGGWLMLALAAGLVTRAYDTGSSDNYDVPVHLLLAGHQVALQWCHDFFNSPRCPVVSRLDWSDLRSLQTLVRSRLMSKASTLSFLCGATSAAVAEEVADRLATLVLRAFVSALPESGAGGASAVGEFDAFASGGRRPQVRVFACGGAVVERSQCLVDAVLLDVALPLGCTAAADRWCEEDRTGAPASSSSGLHSLGSMHARSLDDNGVLEADDEFGCHDGGAPIRTAFYNVSLTMEEADQAADRLHISAPSSFHDGGAGGRDGAPIFNPSQVKRSRLLGLVAQWRALGVGAVLSQKLLHPTLRAHLLASGIVPVERLSIRHAQATHALCGGAMIGVAAAPASVAALGQLGSISEYTLGDRRFVLLQGARALRASHDTLPVVTLLLRAPTQAVADELGAVVQQCLDLLHATMAAPPPPSGQSAGVAFDPRTLCVGGGATEAVLSSYLRMRAARDLGVPSAAIVSDRGSALPLPSGLRRAHVHFLRAGVEHVAGSLDAFASAVHGEHAGRESGEWRDALHEKHESLVRNMLTGAADGALESAPAAFVYGADSTAADPWTIQPIARANSGRPAHRIDQVGDAADDKGLRAPRVLDALLSTRRAIELAVDAAANALRCAGAIGGRS